MLATRQDSKQLQVNHIKASARRIHFVLGMPRALTAPDATDHTRHSYPEHRVGQWLAGRQRTVTATRHRRPHCI